MRRMREIVIYGQNSLGLKVNYRFNMFFREAGKNLTVGKRWIQSDDDLQALYLSKDAHGRAVLYVIFDPIPQAGLVVDLC